MRVDDVLKRRVREGGNQDNTKVSVSYNLMVVSFPDTGNTPVRPRGERLP